MGRVFANGPGDLGSIQGRIVPKILEIVLDTSLLNNIRYISRVKWSNPGKGVAPSPTLTIEKGAFWLPSSTVANFTLWKWLYRPVLTLKEDIQGVYFWHILSSLGVCTDGCYSVDRLVSFSSRQYLLSRAEFTAWDLKLSLRVMSRRSSIFSDGLAWVYVDASPLQN